MTKTISAATVLCLLATVSAPLHAQDATQPAARTMEVRFGDLDIESRHGLAILDARIDKAVRKVCHARFEGPVKTTSDPRDCRIESRQDADVQLARILAKVTVGELAANNIVVTQIAAGRR